MTRPDEDDPRKARLASGGAPLPNPEEVNEFHRYDDVDNSPESHHHTLGVDPNQASPGDHNHDGRNSKLLSSSGAAGDLNKIRGIKGLDSRAATETTPAQVDARVTPLMGGDEGLTMSGPEFKSSQAISTSNLPSDFYGVITVSPWGDDTGGGIHQLAFGSGINEIYHRYGLRSGSFGGGNATGHGWRLMTNRMLFGVHAAANANFAQESFKVRSSKFRITLTMQLAVGQSGSISLAMTATSGLVARPTGAPADTLVAGNNPSGTYPLTLTAVKYYDIEPGSTLVVTPTLAGNHNGAQWVVESCQ